MTLWRTEIFYLIFTKYAASVFPMLVHDIIVISDYDTVPFQPPHEKTWYLHVKTNVQISCKVTVQLISALVLAS